MIQKTRSLYTLIIDVHNLCHRVFHTEARKLSHEGFQTGVLFGFFRSLCVLMENHRPDSVAFCFDSKSSLRAVLYPEYKANRKQIPPDEQRRRKELQRQISLLQHELLRELGFINLYCQEGFEADDLIASLTDTFDQEFIIASSDTDMNQLLHSNVQIVRPPWNGKFYTRQSFRDEYGFSPRWWTAYRAVCGDVSDNIKGIPGVGEVTARRYIRGEPITPRLQQLIKGGSEIIHRNLTLMNLPFKGTPAIECMPQEPLAPKTWKRVMDSIGCKSLVNQLPVLKRCLF